jgi:Lrp/AsnC family transcriptional regulator for asnA, asnC and gidA
MTCEDTGMSRRNDTGAGLDDTSRQIIEQLQEDGRRPYSTIAKAIGLSEAAVRQRVQKLTDSGIIQIVAVTDPMQVGMYQQAMVGIKVDGPVDPVAAALSDIPETSYVVVTAGSFDILCEVVCEDHEHLTDMLFNRIRTIPGVRSTEAFVYMGLRKQTYQWGVQ